MLPTGTQQTEQIYPQKTYVGVRGEKQLGFIPKDLNLGTPSYPNPLLVVMVWEGDQARLLRLEPAASILKEFASNGLEWGYYGQGPHHLATSILLDYTGDAAIAQRYYPEFLSQVIVRLPRDRFELSGREIDQFFGAVQG